MSLTEGIRNMKIGDIKDLIPIYGYFRYAKRELADGDIDLEVSKAWKEGRSSIRPFVKPFGRLFLHGIYAALVVSTLVYHGCSNNSKREIDTGIDGITSKVYQKYNEK